MSKKLGFTFYPKDWWTSDMFFELEENDRYLYLECLFLMYDNGGYMNIPKEKIEKRLRTEISDERWKNVTSHFEHDEELGFTHSSVNKRLRKANASRKNGALGGRPPKPTEPSEEPTENPPLESESKSEEESKENNSQPKDISFDWDILLQFINKTTGRKFKVINKNVKKKYLARLKDGYTKDDIKAAVKNAVKTEFNKNNNNQYLTPEFFSRADTLDKYSQASGDDQKVVLGMNT